MKEIEVKILNVNKKEMQKKLEKLGAVKDFDGELKQIYYDIMDNHLRNCKKSLRLRKACNKTYLTFKHKLNTHKAKICDEFELEVSDFNKMHRILKEAGFEELKKADKYRTSYKLDKTHFELDTYPNEPTLLEIEAPNIKTIEKYVKLLGYTMNDAKAWSYAEILEHYASLKKKKIKKLKI